MRKSRLECGGARARCSLGGCLLTGNAIGDI